MTFTELVSRCKASVSLDVNEHRGVYQALTDWIDDQNFDGQMDPIPERIREEMVRTDTCYRLQFYPETPVGFYVIYGPTLEHVLAEAEAALEAERGRR